MRERILNGDSASEGWSYSTCKALSAGCSGLLDPVCTPYSGTYVQQEQDTVMTDIVTPNFHKLRNSGKIINNPMRKEMTTLRDRKMNYYSRIYDETFQSCGPDQWVAFREDVTSGTLPASTFLAWGDIPEIPEDDLDIANLIDIAVTKAWSRVNVTEAQGLVMAGESKKTVLSMASIISRLIKIIFMIKRLDKRGIAKELSGKELANRYMELRYALRPLMYDAHGVMEAISKKASDYTKRMTFRATGTGIADFLDVNNANQVWSDGMGTNVVNFRDIGTSEISVTVRAGVLTSMEELSQLNTWGMSQPLESMWELVPLSFVVDWIFNIGDTLASWTPNYGIRDLASWYTVETMTYQKLERTVWDTVPPAATSTKRRSIEVEYEDCILEKTVISKERVPNPSRSIFPNFNLRLDTFKLADLLIIAKRFWR